MKVIYQINLILIEIWISNMMVAKKEDTTIQIISMMLTFLLMVFLFSGAMEYVVNL